MSFLYPLGLLGLIGVPVLILIYILKSKYQEKTIASIYIWELSEKFMKKKKPLSNLKGILSLLLQILCVIFVSFSIAHPVLNIKDAAKNYLFIIDESASMNMEFDGKTRFEYAIDEINKIVDESKDGSKYTLIEQNKEVKVTLDYVLEKEKVKNALNKLEPSTLYLTNDDVLEVAQSYFIKDPSLNVYYFTDSTYESNNNVTVINCAHDEYNASIKNCEFGVEGEKIKIYGNFVSYHEDKEIEVQLISNDEVISSINVNALKDVDTSFEFSIDLDNYAYFLVLLNIEDGLEYDNYYYLFGNDAKGSFKTLLVSSEPFFLKNVVSVCGSSNIKVQSSYNGETGYDLYVFDGVAVSKLPEDGAIILSNVSNNVPDSGIIPQEKMKINGGAKLTLGKENNETYNELAKDLKAENIYVNEFTRYSLTKSYSVIYEYDTIPMVFAGTNFNNSKQVVFSFDLHKSSLPLNIDYVPLFRNAISYLIPSLIERTNYVAGESLKINVLPNITSIRMNTSLDYSTFLPLDSTEIYYSLDTVGIYTLEVTNNVEAVKYYYIYVSYPLEESDPIEIKEKFDLSGVKDSKGYDSTYDLLFIVFMILLGVIVIEWEVYVYDEHYI